MWPLAETPDLNCYAYAPRYAPCIYIYIYVWLQLPILYFSVPMRRESAPVEVSARSYDFTASLLPPLGSKVSFGVKFPYAP